MVHDGIQAHYPQNMAPGHIEHFNLKEGFSDLLVKHGPRPSHDRWLPNTRGKGIPSGQEHRGDPCTGPC